MISRPAMSGFPPTFIQLPCTSKRVTDNIRVEAPIAASNIEVETHGSTPAEPCASALVIGLIDSFQFTQDCVAQALEGVHPHLMISAFGSVRDCVAARQRDLDIIIYYWHAVTASEAGAMQAVAVIRRAFPAVPIIVLSDAEHVQQPKVIHNVLKTGVHGFIPTRTTGIQMMVAAIRFVMAGGTFAPLDQLLINPPGTEPVAAETTWQRGLTSRQMAVLSHVQQGKANKLIAHELSVSESAVKIHVRNIMRKMGVTNRTQAASKAQRLWDSTKPADNSDS
jgi:DNA-binding NarL/FixJ family response regulator